ncbi:MAG: HDOD domain-containing protein [Gammaproteobacteria bacterium]|nr:HDOD domain-containing protein [Gammaproteobacteria bacterium]
MNAHDIVESANGLCTLPEVTARLMVLLDDEDPSRQKITELISYDPVLMGRLLSAVNNPPYHGPPLDNATDAVERLGLSDLRKLVQTVQTTGTFKGIPIELVDMNNFWHHSICTALAAESLAYQSGIIEPSQLFVGGLMHDIGQLPIYQVVPDLARQVLRKSGTTEYYRYRAEKEILGEEATHAHVGAVLMRKWGLSPAVREMVEFHHEPKKAVHFPREVSIIHIATAIANCVEPSWNVSEKETTEVQVSAFAWETTGLSPEVVSPTANKINLESFTILDIVDPDSLHMF